MSFILKQFEIGPMQNFGYLIGDTDSKQCVVIDPAWAPDQIISTAEREGFKIAGFAVTHAHYDHSNAIEELLSRMDVPVYAQAEEIEYAKSGDQIVGNLGSTARIVGPEETITLGGTSIKFLHTPGHTPGSQCIQVGNFLVTGDTLFIEGCGRSDLPGGNAGQLFDSLQKISKLPSDLEICPGHDYGSVRQRKLEQEALKNPYLRLSSKEQFIEAVG